jgi:hypothetical protein
LNWPLALNGFQKPIIEPPSNTTRTSNPFGVLGDWSR